MLTRIHLTPTIASLVVALACGASGGAEGDAASVDESGAASDATSNGDQDSSVEDGSSGSDSTVTGESGADTTLDDGADDADAAGPTTDVADNATDPAATDGSNVVPNEVNDPDAMPDEVSEPDTTPSAPLPSDDPVIPTPDPGDSLLSNLVPFQQWPPLGAEAVGLLFSATNEQYGVAFDHSRGFYAVTAPENTNYRFSINGSSPYVVYFEAEAGEGTNFLSQWQVPGTGDADVVYDVAQFGPDDIGRWGLTSPVHLVRVEVNGGVGSANSVHFVPTDVEVLDGTDEYPLDPFEAFVTHRQMADEMFGAAEFVSMFEERRLALERDGAEYVDLGDQVQIFPSWMNDTDTLRLIFMHRHTGAWESMELVEMQCPECPPGAPCAFCDPGPVNQLVSTRLAVEEAVVFEVDKTGETLGTTFHEATSAPAP